MWRYVILICFDAGSVLLIVFDLRCVVLVRFDEEVYVFGRLRCGDLWYWFFSMKVSVLLEVLDADICDRAWFRCGGPCLWKLSM